MKLIRFIFLGLFVFFIGLATFLAEDIWFPASQRYQFSPGSLESQIQLDINKLTKNGHLPKAIFELEKVYILDQRKGKAQLNGKDLSSRVFKPNSNGNFELQIEIFDTQDSDPNSTANFPIVQFSLFDKKSKNKIWELSRQYKY